MTKPSWITRNPVQTLTIAALIVYALGVLGVIDIDVAEQIAIAITAGNGTTAAVRTNLGLESTGGWFS